MTPFRTLLAALMLLPSLAHGQSPATGGVFAVAYVETEATAAAAGRAALELYRDAVREQLGCLAVELFAQSGRPGHFAVLEAWRDQAAFDARDPSHKSLLMEGLEPIRISGYDERLYKPLTLAPPKDPAAVQNGVFVISHVDVAPNTAAPTLLTQLAEASRAEAGNLRFDVVQHAARANHFTVVEQWRSAAALDEHASASHTRRYRDALQPLTGSPLDERVYTAIGAVGGAGQQ
jgi:quinol monooxygenase YgiN